MAHQPDIIPWHLLASNLRWSDGKSSECACKSTNLHPRARAEQGVELTQFVQGFVEALNVAVKHERLKYPRYDAPEPNDVLLDERIIRKINPDVIQWRNTRHAIDAEFDKHPPIPQEMKLASAFFHPYKANDCYQFEEENGKGFFNLEIAKLLIIHGELEPVLRACTREEFDFISWEQVAQCSCMPWDVGWDMLYKHALSAYLCLNVAYCFPELWDEAAGRTKEKDCRHTTAYQHMLRDCTTPGSASEVVTYPHRWFFGIDPDRFDSDQPTVADKQRWLDKLDIEGQTGIIRGDHYGLLPLDDFLILENPTLEFMPSTADVGAVQTILLRCLPIELVLLIMEMAGYKPKRALTIPHDPLHPTNRKALDDYFKQCWLILVRCEMLAQEIDHRIANAEGWPDPVYRTIAQFWENVECESAELLDYAQLPALEFKGAHVPASGNQALE